MKCPCCWAEKVTFRQVKRWKRILLACLLLRPMKCNHCYHRFVASWFLTIGKEYKRPSLRVAPGSRPSGTASAAEHLAAARAKGNTDHDGRGHGSSPRADAA